MPSINEVKERITSSTSGDWEEFEGENSHQVWVLQADPDIRIEQRSEFEDGYIHTWTDVFPDSNSDATARYELYYRNSPIDQFTVIATDGYRFYLPSPKIENSEVDDLDEYEFSFSQYEAALGRIMSPGNFDDWFPVERVSIRDQLF